MRCFWRKSTPSRLNPSHVRSLYLLKTAYLKENSLRKKKDSWRMKIKQKLCSLQEQLFLKTKLLIRFIRFMYVISVHTVLHLPSIWFQHYNCQNWIRPNGSLKYFVSKLSSRYNLQLYMNGIRPTVQVKYNLQAILKRIGRGGYGNCRGRIPKSVLYLPGWLCSIAIHSRHWDHPQWLNKGGGGRGGRLT